jgi:hypothetical protein
MARFPHYKDNAQALGRLLAEASVDLALRERLKEDPAAELSRIGLPPEATSLFNFKIVEDNGDKPFAVLPYRLNREKLNRLDPYYLARIAETTVISKFN